MMGEAPLHAHGGLRALIQKSTYPDEIFFEAVCGIDLVSFHTVEFDLCIKSQLASRNELLGLMWCTFGDETPQNLGSTKSSNSTEWNLINLGAKSL